MSLLSRNTGGKRRAAGLTAVFVGSLLTYLAIIAVPAMAVTTCSAAGAVGTINVGTDDKVVARVNGANYEISVNGGAFAVCGLPAVAATDDLLVIGSDAGAETFTYLGPASFSTGAALNNVNIVDLKNGADTLILEYGGLAAPVIADPGTNDSLLLGSSGPTRVGDMNAGGVADLRIDNAETFTLNGGNGNDSLDAGNLAGMGANAGTVAANNIPAATSPFSGNLNMNGGNGDDTLISGNGNDNFQGGPGADTVSYVAASTAVVVDLTLATGTGMGADTLTDVQNATGGAFNDTITGNALNNILNGGAGNDVLDGLAGDDGLNGDAGDDTLNEGTAANGADTLSGGAGTEVNGDTLNYGGRTGALVVMPGAGAVSGADANADGDASDAGDERDTVLADIENYTLGSAGDKFVGSGAAEFITPGAGNDSVDGGVAGEAACTDVIDESDQTGPATFNLVAGTAVLGTQTDTFKNIEGVSGTEGDDTVIWDGKTPAAPTSLTGPRDLSVVLCIFGGGGVDTVDGSTATSAITLDLVALFGGSAANVDIENAIGGSGGDTLLGNILANRLIGNDGNDVNINGGPGNDFIEGGLGNDGLAGGLGGDTVSYKNATGGMLIDAQLGFTDGPDGQDSIGGFEIFLGSNFDDEIIGGQTDFDANIRIKGRKGNDNLVGTNSSDTINGAGGNDVIRAGGGDDIARGGAGDDLVQGSSGDDQLFGGKGPDTGVGGRGFDSCISFKTRLSCERR